MKITPGIYKQTEKQMEILKHIFDAADRGEMLSFEGLRTRLSYGLSVSKQTLQHSLRYLEAHGLISKNYTGGNRSGMRLTPTLKAYQMYRRAPE